MDPFIGQFIFVISLIDDHVEFREGFKFLFFILFAEEIGFPFVDFSAQIGIFFDPLQDLVAGSSFADEPEFFEALLLFVFFFGKFCDVRRFFKKAERFEDRRASVARRLQRSR